MPRPTEDDDFDDRLRRRPRRDEDEDDYDDRPRRKKKAKKGGGSGVIVAAVGGGLVLLVGLAAGAYFLFGGKGGKPAAGGGLAGGLPGDAPPPGFSAVGDPGIGIKVYLPGVLQGNYVRKGGPQGPPDPNSYFAVETGAGPNGARLYAQRVPGYTPGTTVEQLRSAYDKMPFGPSLRKSGTVRQKATTVAGRPGMELVIKELPDIWDDTPMNAEFFKDKNQKEAERVAKEGLYFTILVFGNGEWTYVIALPRKLAEPDPETVKTVTESVKFN